MERNLLSLAQDVRTQLDAFVALQAGLTAQPGFFGKLKRFFRPVDFKATIQTAREISANLASCLKDLETCLTDSSEEKEFQQALSLYITALSAAVAKMILTVEGLWLKNQGRSAWESNTKLMHEYQLAEQKYLDLGEKLNSSYRRMTVAKNQ